MGKYLFAYKGGAMASTEEEQQAAMAAWGAWFGQLGSAIADPGNPFGPSATVNGGAPSDGGASSLTGYTLINADSLADATKLAEGAPVLSHGGSVEVYETIEISM